MRESNSFCYPKTNVELLLKNCPLDTVIDHCFGHSWKTGFKGIHLFQIKKEQWRKRSEQTHDTGALNAVLKLCPWGIYLH